MTNPNTHDNYNNNEIPLTHSERLKNEGIIHKFVKNTKENYIEIALNHKYDESSIIISTAIIKSKKHGEGWNDFKELVRKELQRYRICEEHINLILTVISRNYKIVSERSNKNNSDFDNQQEEQDETDEKERISLPQELVEIALNNCKLFKDEFGIPHALVKLDDYYDVLLVEGTKFKRYISKLYYDTKEGRIANPESIKTSILHLEAIAEFGDVTIPLHFRVAWSNPNTKDAIYYDLSDSKGRCIKITKDNGWKIVDNRIEILFRRYKHLSPQIEPIKKVLSNNDIDDIDNTDNKIFDKFIDLLNVKDDDNKLLLKCYIISLFIPGIAKPVLMLHGEQGSAKSTLQELIKILVDPSSIKILTFPKDTNEFIQQLSHNYIAYYDNISEIKDWISNLLCSAVTGNSFSKRQLFTDDDDFFYNFKRVVGLNGINLGATKADLLDRGLIIQLERIPKEKRRKVEEIWKEFEELKPRLLGYTFDVLVKVLQFKSNNPEFSLPGGLNRMADWEEYAEIISRCIGEKDNEFQRVYQDNIGVQIDEAIAASPLSMAIVELMKDKINDETGEIIELKTEWQGKATQLSEELNNIAIEVLNINIQKLKSWPKSPNYLSRRLNEIKTNLREKGIEIEKGIKDKKDNRLIIIRKV